MLERAKTREQFANASRSILDELKAITQTAKAARSIGDQLSERDSVKSAELKNRLQSIRLSSYVDSARERDVRVMQGMYVVAWKTYSEIRSLELESDLSAAALVALRSSFPEAIQLESTSTRDCSIDNALLADFNESLNRIDAGEADRVLSAMNLLKAKYNLGPKNRLDPLKMKPEDTRELQDINSRLRPLWREQQLALDLHHILEWWQTANMVYDSRRNDIRIHGGSIEEMGNTLDAKLASASDRVKAYVSLWKTIDEKVPTEDMKEFEMLARAGRRSQ